MQARNHSDYSKAEESFMKWCVDHVDLQLVVGRQTIKSIDQTANYLTGTDISTLMTRGKADIVTYVSSGFNSCSAHG